MTTRRPLATATTFVAALLVAAFAAELAYGVAGDESALLTVGALKTVGWTAADAWRIGTYWLLHLNAVHLAMNVAALWWLGHIVERRTRSHGLLVAWAVSVLAAGAAAMVVGDAVRTTGVAVGASGGDFGLLASALFVVGRRGVPTTGERSLRRWLVAFAGLALGMSVLPGVGGVAHVGGFIGGYAAMLAYARRHASDQLKSRT